MHHGGCPGLQSGAATAERQVALHQLMADRVALGRAQLMADRVALGRAQLMAVRVALGGGTPGSAWWGGAAGGHATRAGLPGLMLCA